MRFSNIRIAKFVLFVLLLFWSGIFLSHKIDLTTADLGRHIRNGDILLNGSASGRSGILNTNFYSYTMPEKEFANHHWLSGVYYYLVQTSFGFQGQSVFYVLFALGSITLFFDVARRKSNFWIAFTTGIIVLPLVVKRAEVRPEVFTLFLTAVFFWLLSTRLVIKNDKWIFVLPLLMLLWVNLHIGFVFGFLVLGAFGLQQVILLSAKKQNHFTRIFIVSVLCLLAACINPHFINGLVYPFNIFKDYGYLIVENQSIGFLERLNFTQGQHFILYRIVVLILAFSIAAAGIRNWRKINIPFVVLTLISGGMAYTGIRNFPLFALFVLPAISYHLYLLKPKEMEVSMKQMIWTAGFVIVIFALVLQNQTRLSKQNVLGWGLQPDNNKSAEFVKENKIKGPIFNNYDTGGYLIYHLYPEKVFVDNRPEAYTTKFFREEYIKPQEDDKKFRELGNKYKFNVIFFSHRDYTPWAQAFLVRMTKDKEWAPVYVDNYNIIFLKRNSRNNDLVKKYELSEDKFRVTENQ